MNNIINNAFKHKNGATRYTQGADPAQDLTGSNGNPKNFDRHKAARKIFRPARGVRGHASPENFENPTSHMG